MKTFADNNVAVIPDFIADCGIARAFAYPMENEVEITDKVIFSGITNIKLALEKARAQNALKKTIATMSLKIALSQLL